MPNKTLVTNSINRQYKDLGGEVFAETIAINTDENDKDAFGRSRTSQMQAVFDSILQYGKMPLSWGEGLVGGGTSTHLPNESSVDMAVGTTSGDKVIRQTHKYHRYQPGKSQLIMQTAVIGAGKTNLRKRIGSFDTQNGVFFEQVDNIIYVVQRSFTSGAAVDTRVAQTSWNMDKLDGLGSSGVTLDLTKSQVLVIDLAWLGVGRVRFGVYSGGKVVYCHEFINYNTSSTVYMTTANLPIRLEIENTGITASASSLKQICATVISEGGRDPSRGIIEYSANLGATYVAATTRRPVLTIRPKALFNSITNRGQILPNTVAVTAKTNDCFFEVVRNGTLGGTPVWTSVGSNSLTESDTAATTITGGDVIFSGYVPVPTGSAATTEVNKIFAQEFSAIAQSLGLSLNWDGTVQETMSIVVTSVSATTNVLCAMDFIEIY